eukprot:SAG25_NODE_889_length_4913_cov_47.520980_1_plen_189_part_00
MLVTQACRYIGDACRSTAQTHALSHILSSTPCPHTNLHTHTHAPTEPSSRHAHTHTHTHTRTHTHARTHTHTLSLSLSLSLSLTHTRGCSSLAVVPRTQQQAMRLPAYQVPLAPVLEDSAPPPRKTRRQELWIQTPARVCAVTSARCTPSQTQPCVAHMYASDMMHVSANTTARTYALRRPSTPFGRA